jgi:hypothetical protein
LEVGPLNLFLWGYIVILTKITKSVMVCSDLWFHVVGFHESGVADVATFAGSLVDAATIVCVVGGSFFFSVTY